MSSCEIQIFLTARATGDRLAEKRPVRWSRDKAGTEYPLINVYEDVEYQEIIGFGGAITESSAVTFMKLPPAARKRVLDAYFDPARGNRYTFCRTHMNSCDFSTGNYSCCDRAGDTELSSFNINRDKQAMLPLLKAAAKRAGGMKLFISPWSPPAWMKTNRKMNRGGKLLPQYRAAWALHYARFIKAYEAEGVPVWGLTVQNEPKATQRWDSCVYTAEEERDFVKKYLGPTLRRERLAGRKLMIWDHNRERLYDRARCMFEDRESAKSIWGAAFHWYSGDHFEALDAVHHRWPDKGLVFSEGCVELHKDEGAWANGERYGRDIIGCLNSHTAAWCDWNILVDSQGGPNHVQNYCEAPIMGHLDKGRLEFKPSYYYIGHFSRFIPPGSRRIAVTRFNDSLLCTGAITRDERIAVVVMNKTDSAVSFSLRNQDRLASLASPAHSIMTLVFR